MMTIPDWLITVLIALAALTITAAAFILGRRKDREGKIVVDTTERTEIKVMVKSLSEALNVMDRSINATLCRMEGQFLSMEKSNQDHEQRITRVEESTKAAHKRVDELKK